MTRTRNPYRMELPSEHRMPSPPRRTFRLAISLLCLCAASALPACDGGGGRRATEKPGAAWVTARDPQAPKRLVQPAAVEGFGYRKPYRFSEDSFTARLPYWVPLLEPYMEKPGLQYLEVGVNEGRSLMWMIDHVLTHPESHATSIDVRRNDAFLENIETSGAADRITLIQSPSQLALRELPPESFDVIYIEGSHTADDVLENIVLAWRLLKPNGLMLLDDYLYTGSADADGSVTPPELLPRPAIDAFISAFRNSVKVVHKGYQVGIRKRPDACSRGREQCSTLGEYSYDWRRGVLYRGEEDIEISENERKVLEALIRSKRGDALTLRFHSNLLKMAIFRNLDSRLGLGIVPSVQPNPGT